MNIKITVGAYSIVIADTKPEIVDELLSAVAVTEGFIDGKPMIYMRDKKPSIEIMRYEDLPFMTEAEYFKIKCTQATSADAIA